MRTLATMVGLAAFALNAWAEPTHAFAKVLFSAREAAAQEIPDEARRQFIQFFGGPFLVYRDKVQGELKLSDDQKQKVEDDLKERIRAAMEFFQTADALKPEEREKEHKAYREKSREKLAAFLKDVLKDDQLKRLRQLDLQNDGLFALLGRPELAKELKITDEQRKQFMPVAQELQKKVQPLVKEAQSGANPQEIMAKIIKIRKAQEVKIQAILNEAQRKQWQEMVGKAFEFDD